MAWFSSLAFRWLAGATLALVLLCVLLLAGVPPVDRDALTHHLAVPKLYLQHGGIYEIPAVPFSYYPMNLDLLYLVALYLGSDILPKYIHFAFGLLTALMLYRYLRDKLQSSNYGLLGCLLFLSLPVIVKLSVTVYVDLGLIFFSTSALLQLFRWAESGFRIRNLLLSGVLTGLCLGTKYNGMLSAFLLGMVVLSLSLRASSFSSGMGGSPTPIRKETQLLRALAHVVVFSSVTLAVFSPWMIRNYIWTGNPVYPLADGIFGTSTPGVSDIDTSIDIEGKYHSPTENAGSGLNHLALRTVVFGESILDILFIPVRIFFHGIDDSPQYFDGRLNPYLLVFPIVALALTRRGRRPDVQILEQWLMAGFAVVYLLLSFLLTDMRVRYVAPILPPLVLLTVYGVHDLKVFFQVSSSNLKRLGEVGINVALVVLVGINGLYIHDLFGRVDPFSFLTGKISRQEYIQKHRPEYAAIVYANRHIASDARILCLFTGNRIYYSDREMVCDSDMFRSIVGSAMSPEAVVDHLVQKGISHLLIQGDIFHTWADSQFDLSGRQILQTLFQEKFVRIFEGHGYFLFRIARD